MSYSPTVWNNGDTITAQKLNKIQQELGKISNYDLIIEFDPSGNESINNFTIVKGNILELEERAAEFQPIRGVLVRKNSWSSVPSGSNIQQLPAFFYLTQWDGPYRCLIFEGTTASVDNFSSHTIHYTTHWSYILEYNASTGNLTRYAYGYAGHS